MAALLASFAASKFLGPVIAGAALFGVGFTAAEVYEHKVPWGLEHQRDKIRDGVPAQVAAGYKAGADAQTKVDAATFTSWSASLTSCRADVAAARDNAATLIGKTDAFTSSQSSAAYRMGRASCGASNAQTGPGRGVSGPGGLRPAPAADFAGLFQSGAFAPSAQAPVPSGHQR